MQTRCLEKRRLCCRKVAQVYIRDPQEFLNLVFVRMDRELLFEFLARLGVTFFLIVLKIGVAEKTMSAWVLRIELDRPLEFRDCLLRDLGKEIGAAKQHMKRRRLPHRRLKLLEQGRGLRQFLCGEVGQPQEVAGFEIVLEIY